MKKTCTIVRMDADGDLRIVGPDGELEPLPVEPIKPASAEDIEAAALADPDNPPLTEERRSRLKPAPRARTLRRALHLTQEEFAARYHIPLGTLRDWEQRRSEPDQPARAYLTVIANDPEGVRRALISPRV